MTERKTNYQDSYLGPELTRRDNIDMLIDKFLIRGLAGEFTVEGQENLPQSGPLVIGFAPHSGSIDANVMRLATREAGLKPFDIMTKLENMETIPQAIRGPRIFPVDRDGILDQGAVDYALSILATGGMVASAFEGTRGRGSETDLKTLQKAKKGMVLMAMQAEYQGQKGVPILPVVVMGPEKILPVPEEIIAVAGKAGFFKEMAILMLKRRSQKPPLHVTICAPYEDHLADVGLQRRDLLHALQFHADAIMMTRIIPAITDYDPNHPLGYYQGKILDYAERKLLSVDS